MPRRSRKPAAEGSQPTRLSLTLLAEYRQVHLMDARCSGDLSEAWSVQAVEDLVAVADGIVGLGCVRDADVRLTVELLATAPDAAAGVVPEGPEDEADAHPDASAKRSASASWRRVTMNPGARTARDLVIVRSAQQARQKTGRRGAPCSRQPPVVAPMLRKRA